MSVTAQMPRRRVGRPATQWLSVEEVATLLDVPAQAVRRALDQGSFFPRAQVAGVDGWRIPLADVRHHLGGGLPRLLSVQTLATLLDVAPVTIYRRTALAPGQPGRIASELLLGSELRIPESEYWRLRGQPAPARP